MTKHHTDLYFEAHITVEPINDVAVRRNVVQVGNAHGFRLATFLMKKDDGPVPDDFFSARGPHYESLEEMVLSMVRYLGECGVTVKRYKIENTLLDVKIPKEN